MLRRLVLISISILFLASCSGRGRLILKPPSQALPLQSQAKARILERLRARTLPPTIRAKLETDIDSGAGRDSFVQALTFKEPNFFRLEAFATGINTLIFIATSDGVQFRAVLPTEKKVLIGIPSPKSLSSLIHLPLTPLEMVALITGRILPGFLEDAKLTLNKDTDGSLFLKSLGQTNRELRVRFDNETNLRILELSLSDRGSGALLVKYLYQVGQLRLLSVKLPEIEAKVEIKEIKQHSSTIPDSIFRVMEPVGYKVERLD